MISGLSMLNFWKEDEHSSESYKDIIEQIEKNIVEVPGNLFKDTDLVVFDKNYRGILPLNGIQEKEYLQLHELIENLPNFFHIEGSEAFKKTVEKDIKIILSRKIGQDLINKILDSKEKIHIHESLEQRHCYEALSGQIFLSHENILFPVLNAKGKQTLLPIPTFLMLVHELIHQLHTNSYDGTEDGYGPLETMLDFNKQVTLLHPSLDAAEEQITILGFVKNIIQPPQHTELSEEESDPEQLMAYWNKMKFEKKVKKYYSRFNETLFTSSFGLPPRVSHRGTSKRIEELSLPELVFLNVEEILIIALNSKEKEKLEIAHPLPINEGNLTNGYAGRTPLTTAIATNNYYLFDLLIKSGASINTRDVRGETPLFTALTTRSIELIPNILACSPDLSTRDKNGQTIIQRISDSLSSFGMRRLNEKEEKHKLILQAALGLINQDKK